MSFFETISNAEIKGIPCALCIIINARGTTPRTIGSKMIVYENGEIFGSIGGGSVELKVKEKARESIRLRAYIKEIFQIENGSERIDDYIEVFIEPILPGVKLFVFGAGHIGKQVAWFAKKMGWQTIIIDDRPEVCNTENIPNGDKFITGFTENEISDLDILNGYCVLVTRNSEIDQLILHSIIKKNASYIGVLGSIKRWKHTKEELLKSGVTEIEIDRITAPIGIDINAETPEEIAISIISQIIKVRNRKE